MALKVSVRPPNKLAKGLYGPSRNSSNTPLTSGGSANGNCTTKPKSAIRRELE